MEREKRVSVKAILAGVGVYAAGLLLIFVVGVLLGSAAAYYASRGGASQQQIIDAVVRRLASPAYVLAVLGLDALFTLLAGYAAAPARAPRAALLKHAVPVGLLSRFTGILFVLAAPFTVPVWLLPLLLLAPVPLAVAGGYVRSRGWTPLAPEEDAEEAEDADASEEELIERFITRKLKQEAQAARSVGQLVQQRREQELRRQQERQEAEKRYAFELAMQEARAEAYEDLRAVVRGAFMTHPAATEEDFERCWPELRDEVFKQHALRVYNERQAHAREEV